MLKLRLYVWRNKWVKLSSGWLLPEDAHELASAHSRRTGEAVELRDETGRVECVYDLNGKVTT